jgi:hypothetical protein
MLFPTLLNLMMVQLLVGLDCANIFPKELFGGGLGRICEMLRTQRHYHCIREFFD